VDTESTPLLLRTVRSGKLNPSELITHRFKLSDAMKAYDAFSNAAREHVLKVILSGAA
jgi:alcohol dehydrogenase